MSTGVVGHEWWGCEGGREIFFEVSPCHSFLAMLALSAPHRCVVRCALRWPSRVASGDIAAL